MKSKSVLTKPHSEAAKKEYTRLLIVACIILTIAAFYPVFKAGFVNWDDEEYVVKNTSIHTPTRIHKIISEPVSGNYHPVTMLSLAIDYWISDGNPKWFHFVNVLIHIINTILVFIFIFKISGSKKWIAFITAMFFAVHPLHVESVAWISERKDLLYSTFFLLGLLLYLNYLNNNKLKTLAVVFLLFVFSLLSKPAAVIFPVVLLAIDFYKERLKQKQTYIEKIPFFILSVIFGLITIHIQKESEATGTLHFPLFMRLLYANYGIMMYLIKTVFPVRLCAFYPFPAVNAKLPLPYFISPLFSLMLLWVFVISIKKNKAIAFGILFYIVNLILVLQLIPVGSAVIADRYTYIPLIGPFYLAGVFVQQRIDNNNGKIPLLWCAVLSVLILSWVILTNRLSATWKNSATLWDRVIKICPGSQAYGNRGLVYKNEGKTKEALDMFTKAIELDKFQTDALINRANIYFRQQRYVSAIRDYTQCLAVEPNNDLALANRGGAYLAIGMVDSARADLNRAIEINPLTKNGYKNRGMLHILTKQYHKAIDDYKKHLTIAPDETGEVWNKIGYAYQQLGEHHEAIDAFSRAITIYENGSYYYLRALSRIKLNETDKARADVIKAIQLGFSVDKDLLKSLGINPDSIIDFN